MTLDELKEEQRVSAAAKPKEPEKEKKTTISIRDMRNGNHYSLMVNDETGRVEKVWVDEKGVPHAIEYENDYDYCQWGM